MTSVLSCVSKLFFNIVKAMFVFVFPVNTNNADNRKSNLYGLKNAGIKKQPIININLGYDVYQSPSYQVYKNRILKCKIKIFI